MGDRSAFPRVSGGIVVESFSIASFFTGLLAVLPAGLLLLLGSVGRRTEGIGTVSGLVWGATVLLFVSRFGQLGVAGDEDGGLFSSLAGTWSTTALAAARLLVLWAVWLLPFVAWAFLLNGKSGAAAIAVPGFAPFVPRIPFLLGLWTALGVIFAFAFIAVAAAAPGFGDLFSPGLWRTLFAGRPGELFVVIAGTLGPPAAVVLVVFPVMGALAPHKPKLALTLLAPVLVYLVGMVLTLQGKLAGAFAAGGLAEDAGELVPIADAPAESPAVSGAPAAAPEAAPPARVHAPAAAAVATPAAAPAKGDPKALHDAWRVHFAAGNAEAALPAAREAIAAGLAWGNPRIAAEIYRFHLDRLEDLGLDRGALDVLADQLLRDGDVAAAAWTFSQALDKQPGDPKAFKGLLRVADHHLEKAKAPLEAVRVYRYLLERAPASPFADHARDLLADAERKAARPAGPQG